MRAASRWVTRPGLGEATHRSPKSAPREDLSDPQDAGLPEQGSLSLRVAVSVADVEVTPTGISGCIVFTPRQFADDRGRFLEFYRADVLAQAVGHRLALAQGNTSVSRRGVLRGVHFADVPPGQAKYVTCLSGAVLDVVTDLREGSPTFGLSEAVALDDRDRRALYIAEGLGHSFLTLSESATVSYLCSTPYTPTREHELNPLDPHLALPWPEGTEPVLSPKDARAPGLHDARERGLLPSYDVCLAYRAELLSGGDLA